MSEAKSRMVGPDLIKIAATFYVIFIHHKVQYTTEFYMKYAGMICGFLIGAAILSVVLYGYGKKQEWNPSALRIAVAAPLLFVVAHFFLCKYAVSFFLIISGFMLTGSLEKGASPIKEWYRPNNLIPRILRFYVTLIPIVIVGVLVHIFLQEKPYDLAKIGERLFLGGFKPGSYYIVIMAQFIPVFPVLYLIVKRWRAKGLIFILCLTLLWDIVATGILHIPDKAYKFCILRLLPQFAFGIYARLTNLQRRPLIHWGMFLVGLVYLVVFVILRAVPLPIFYQWRCSSLVIAIFLYPIIVFLLSQFQKISYTDSTFSKQVITLSNATYHIFLFQMLYYNIIGYDWNAKVNNIILTMPVNLLICFMGGVLFYLWFSPVENKLMKGLKTCLTPKNKR